MVDRTLLDPNFAVTQPGSTLLWYDAAKLTVTGQGWSRSQLPHPWSRLPSRAQTVVRPPVWSLGLNSAGVAVEFASDADEFAALWTLLDAHLAMDHMPATGVSGLDLYVRSADSWHWLGVGRPTKTPTNHVRLAGGFPRAWRDYRLYLPLYNGVSDLQLGIPIGASIRPSEHAASRPIVFYGTSIVQGGCASRPGMAYPAIIGRILGVPTLNLGFSGNGQAEPEVASLLAELDPAAFVLDPLPNLTPSQIAERIDPFVAELRRRHPRTPILLVGNILYQGQRLLWENPDHIAKNELLDRIAARLMATDPLIALVRGEQLLGDDGEATVDGTHPTDVGFQRIAAAMTPRLSGFLRG